MNQTDAKRKYYEAQGFTDSWPEYIAKLVERDERKLWLKESRLPLLPPLKVERPHRHYLSIFMP